MLHFAAVSMLAVLIVTPMVADAGVRKIRSAAFSVPNEAGEYNGIPVYDSPRGTIEGRLYRLPDGTMYRQESWLDSVEVPESIDTNEKTFVFSPAKGYWAAYDADGDLIRKGIASGGSSFCKDLGGSCRTKVGDFRIYRRGDAECRSNKYPLDRAPGEPGSPMPYCAFFNGGMAIHASGFVPKWNASHGCVRTPHQDMEWLHHNFLEMGTRVIIKPYKSTNL